MGKTLHNALWQIKHLVGNVWLRRLELWHEAGRVIPQAAAASVEAEMVI
jgi:hypothetical protein